MLSEINYRFVADVVSGGHDWDFVVVCAALGRQIEDLCIELILDLLKCAKLVTMAQKDDNQS